MEQGVWMINMIFWKYLKTNFERIQPATSKIYDACRNPETPSWGNDCKKM